MSAFQPLTAPFGLGSAEDPMELYPDQDYPPTADEGIDIDLDLTADLPQNINDDQMIEDPEVGMEQPEDQRLEAGHDEQMVDETGEEDGIIHGVSEDAYQHFDEDLDDIDDGELNDDLDMNAGVTDQILQLDQGHFDASEQDTLQQAAQPDGYLDAQPSSETKPDTHSAREDTQALAGQDQTHEETVVQSSSPPSLGGQSSQQIVSSEETYVSRDQAEELTQKTQSASVEHASGSQGVQDTIGKSQTINLEGQLQTDQSETPAAGISNAVGKSVEESKSSAAGASLLEGRHEVDLLDNDAGPLQTLADAPPSRREFSVSNEAGQNQENLHSTAVSYEPQPDSSASTTSQPSLEHEADVSQDNPYVHAVIVTYQGSEMFLFPPAAEEQDDNQTYFLTNEALAAGPIQNLLEECRSVLEGSIIEQEELEIEIGDLGLRICESTVDAATTSLTHILDVYLQLHYHDGNETPSPMHMTLSTNVRFSHRLEYLTNFVADGKGFSQLEYEDSSYDSGLDELQETATSQLVEDAAANLNSGDANEVPSNQNQGQQSLSVEDSASQVLAVDSHIAVGPPSSGGEQQITNELATMRKTTQGDLDSLSDEENPVNGDATSVADSLTIPPMHAPEGIEQLQEDLYRDGEAIEDYEDYAHNGQEEDGNNNEDSSAGSSTIQGDSVTEHEDVGSLKAKAAFDGGPTSAEQHIAQVPEQEADDEDVITYETDEEDGNGNFDDSSLQNTEDIGLADAEVAAPKFVAPPDAEGTASHGLMWTSETGADVLHDQDTEAHTTDRDEPEIHSVDGVGAEDEERLEMITEEGTSKSAIPSYHTQVGISTASGPLYAHQEPDQGRILLDPSGLDHTHFQTTKSGVPAPEDEDEITFDDEIEVEAEKEGLAVASTDVASEQTTVSSPGALKRPRATDDDIVLPNTDTKRVRSA